MGNSFVNSNVLFSNRDLRRLIVPLAIEQLLWLSVGLADTMMVSSIGEASISGVSLINMLNSFMFYIFAGIGTGGAVVASQFLGAEQDDKARNSAKQQLMVTLVIGFAILMYCEISCDWTIRLIYGELPPDVMKAAHTYFQITAFSFPMMSIYNSCAALLRSQSKSMYSLYSCALSNVINIVGNSLFIFVLKYGVAGAAWATVMARGISMLFMVFLLTKRQNRIYLSFRERWKVDWGVIRRILHIGIPSGVESSVFTLGRLLVTGVIAAFGTSQLAANSVANTMDYLSCMAGNAFSLGIITVVGQAVGRADVDLVRFYIWKMMKCACLFHFLWGLIVFAVTPLCMSLYTLTDETRHLALILIAIHNGLGLVLWPWSFVFPNALRSTNDVRFIMFWSIASMFVVRVGMSYIFGGIHFLALGAIGVWMAMVLDWLTRITGFLWRYHSGAWRKLMFEK